MRVTLLERRARLGGRAGSFRHGPSGAFLDYSQHVLLGCCTNLLDLCERLGTRHLIDFSDELTFLDRAGHRSRLAPTRWAPPFHLLPSLLQFKSLTAWDKWTVARGLCQLMIAAPRMPAGRHTGQTMADWLRHAGQPQHTIDRFWRTFLISALNDEPAHVDVRYGMQVFCQGLLNNRHAYRLGLPRVCLAELWTPHSARRHLTVMTRCEAAQVLADAHRVTGVQLADGTPLRADHVVMAVPPYRVAGLLPTDVLRRDERFAHLDRFRFSPIVAVHLWFGRPVMHRPHVYVASPHVQWVFNVSAYRPHTAPTGQYLQAVLSAPDWPVARPHALLDLTLRELSRALPGARGVELAEHRVIGVKRATFAPVAGVDAWRPGPAGRTLNLYIAGDWTDTGWPATMEGAVRSGYACAEAVLRAERRPCRLVRPDLPAEGLTRWWGA